MQGSASSRPAPKLFRTFRLHPLQLLSLSCPNPPIHVNCHHIGTALFSSLLSQALNREHHALSFSPALNSPPIHVNFHRIGRALFSPTAMPSLAAIQLQSVLFPWPPEPPRDADDALFAVDYITGITTPLKTLICHYRVAASFCRSPPPGSGFTSPELATTQLPHPPRPLYSLRSLQQPQALPTGWLSLYIYNIYFYKPVCYCCDSTFPKTFVCTMRSKRFYRCSRNGGCVGSSQPVTLVTLKLRCSK